MLFGHQDNNVAQPDASASQGQDYIAPTDSAVVTPGVNPLAIDPATGASLPAAPADAASEPSVLDQPAHQAPAEHAGFAAEPAPADDPSTPFSTYSAQPQTEENTAPAGAGSLDAPASTPGATFSQDSAAPAEPQRTPVSGDNANGGISGIGAGDLLDLKQQAISQLSPLVNHLDQTPEEKFRTTMMLIQATDNSSLLRDAYDAAQAITDEKVRAQALLDVVNEINYFTQQSNS